MAQTKKLEQEQWSEFLSVFSNGNRGRLIRIEVEDTASGEQPIVDAAPLFAIDYDPVHKGNDLVISTGRDAVDYSHTVIAPTEIWQAQDDSGEVTALEIINQNDSRTIIVLKP